MTYTFFPQKTLVFFTEELSFDLPGGREVGNGVTLVLTYQEVGRLVLV